MSRLEKETLILLRENLIETIARSSDAVGNIDRRIAIIDCRELDLALDTSAIETQPSN
jgi:hypothetical protein